MSTSAQQRAQYDKIWDDVVKNAAEESLKPKLQKPSIQMAGRKGWSMRAIEEAYNGQKATNDKSARLGRILGVTYLLSTEAIELIDEAELMMDREFRMSHDFKTGIKMMNTGFDKFYTSIKKHISANAMKDFKDDLKVFDVNVRSWANIEGFKVKTKEDDIKFCKERLINLHKETLEKMTEYKALVGEDGLKIFMQELKEIDFKYEQKNKS